MIFESPKATDIGGFYSSSLMGEADKKDPEKVGAMFEAIFYRMILKEARESSLGDEIFGNKQVENYKEMRDEELAQNLAAKGHLGVKKIVVDHIEKVQGKDTVPPEMFQEVFFNKKPEKNELLNTLSLGLLK
jgi:Rod binding domain-containing protein